MHRPEGFGPTFLSFRNRTTAVYHCAFRCLRRHSLGALKQFHTCRPATTVLPANGNFKITKQVRDEGRVYSGRGPRPIFLWRLTETLSLPVRGSLHQARYI